MLRKADMLVIVTLSLLSANLISTSLDSDALPLAHISSVIGDIKIGIIGPQALSSHWYPSGMRAGTELAQHEINSRGGVYLSSGPNGAGYYNISLVFGHEHAITGPGGTPEPNKAYDEMIRLITVENCTVVIGGFRTECVVKEIQAAVEEAVPFFINGASTSELTNASTQPYVWRINPINSTMLFKTIAGALAYFLIPYKLQPLFGHCLICDSAMSFPSQVKNDQTSLETSRLYLNNDDKDGNRVDDLIDAAAVGPFDIFVDYAVHPNSSHIDALNQTVGTGSISSVYQYIDTIAARNVPEALIPFISNLTDVTMVWKQPEVKSFLDVSTRAIKARYSTTYSDEYVWSGPGDAGDNITKGENITIAIMDTGVDDEHEALNGKFLAGFDATKFEDLDGDGDDDRFPYEPADGSTNPDDLNGPVWHGTHCASTALGNPSDGMYMGVAPEAMLVDIRVLTALGTGSMDDVIKGVEWAQTHKDTDWGVPGYEGIDVLSVSLGSSDASDGGDPCSRAINNAVEAGIVVVVAAGNDGPDNDGLGAPAAADLAVTVAAVDDNETIDRSDDTIANFSSRGPRDDDGDTDPYDELKPEVAAYGVGITAARGSDIPGGANITNQYHELSGTSMATPHVAGVAALILSHYESIGTPLTPGEVDEILRYTAEDRDGAYNTTLNSKYDVDYGWGIVDAYWSVYPHDITVTAVTSQPQCVCPGDLVYVNVTVENQGGIPGMSRAEILEIFNVSVYYGSNLIETKPNISLLPGDSTTIQFTCGTSGHSGTYSISARASVVPLEFETGDNSLIDGTITISARPPQVRVAVLAEDLAWTEEMFFYLTNPGVYPFVLGPYANVTYAARIPEGTTDCSIYLDAVNASKARLLIHIFSGVTGIPLMAQFGAKQIKAMPVGINVMGQLEQHWANTGGGCDYESILNFAGTRTPIIPGLTDVFWDNFVGNFSAWPMYTAWGAYDGVYAMAEAFEAIGTTNKVQLKNYLEDPSYQRQGLTGIFKYTSNHDVYSNDMADPIHVGPTWTSGYVRAMVVQWQVQWSGSTPIGGRMEVVCPVDQVYSKKWAIPPEMYPLVEDITYDGKVDMRDVGMACRAFGSYPGHPRWEKEADINFDNKVDMKDIGAIARKFQTTVELPLD